MKKHFMFICMMALAVSACHKPEPNNGDTEPTVKKYLVKQLLNDDPEKIMLAIDWNDDCTSMLNVKYGTGNGHLLDYNFTYYDNDSIRVIISVPSDSYPLCCVWYDRLMIHLRQDRIDSICCYVGNVLKDVEHYYYNDDGNLIRRTYFDDVANDEFYWNGDNVVEYLVMENHTPVVIDSFTDYIHPHYTLPFYLSNEVAFEIRQPLFSPLWKHQPLLKDHINYEADEDGYLTKMIFDSTHYWITYYYTTPKNSN